MTNGTSSGPHFDPFADPFGEPVPPPSAETTGPPRADSAPAAPAPEADFDPEKTTQFSPTQPAQAPAGPDASWDPERTTVVASTPPPSQAPPPVFNANQRPGPPPTGHAGAYAPGPASGPALAYSPPPVYTASYAPQAPRRSRGPLIAIVAAVAVVVVIVTIVVAVAVTGGSGSAGSPQAAVKSYLEALARGDAAAALALGKDQPGSKDLLTDDVLKRQIAKMPITDIKILDDGSPVGGMAMVHVSARFGDQVSDARLTLHEADGWKLDTAAIKIDLTVMGQSNKALKTMTVFGKAADNPVYVFPGWIDYGNSNANVAVTATSPLLGELNSYTSGYIGADMDVTLSDSGNKDVMSALSDDLAKCTASNRLAPPGCPLKVQPYGLVDGTARWGSMSDLGDVKVIFNPYDMTATMIGSVKTSFTAQSTTGGLSDGNLTGFISGKADLSTEPPTVTYN